jgi:hypothetical protein
MLAALLARVGWLAGAAIEVGIGRLWISRPSQSLRS